MIETDDTTEEVKWHSLPDGWHWVRLGDVAEYINGRAFKPDEWGNVGLPIIRIQNLTSQDAPFNYFNGDVDVRHQVNDGDLLISWSASLDAFIWTRGNAVLNQHIFKVLEKGNSIIRDYLYFAARAAMTEIRTQVHGATMQHITKPEFENIRIPLPPLPEQRRIAAVLRERLAAVEQARAAAEAQLAAAKALPAAYLRAVFESDEAPAWPRVRLGDICELLPARSISTNGDLQISTITTACLSETGFRPAGVKPARMWTHDAIESTVNPGEILIARSNTGDLVGRVAQYVGDPPNVVASDLTIRLWAMDSTQGEYLSRYLTFLYVTGYWKERAGGASGSMKKITRAQLVEVPIPCPSVEVQRTIVAILRFKLEHFGVLRSSLKYQLDGVAALPQALLRQAFAGEL